MKKTFIALLAIASVAACNKAEVIDTVEGEAIEFGDAFVDNATKADYSTNDVEKINVYGTVNNVNIFDYATVEKKTAAYGTAWTCDVTQYWIENAAYKFAALVDVPKANITTDAATGMPVSFTYTADGKTDVLYDYAEATGKDSGNGVVAFTFKHLLAKAYFTATSTTNDANYTYSITNVKVTSTYPNGTYTVYTSPEANAAGSWGSYGAPTQTAFASIENVVYNTPKTNAELLLIPGATVGVSFSYTLYIGGKEVTTRTYTANNVATLAQNSVYNFNVLLSVNEPIQFTVTEKPQWNATTKEDLDVSL